MINVTGIELLFGFAVHWDLTVELLTSISLQVEQRLGVHLVSQTSCT